MPAGLEKSSSALYLVLARFTNLDLVSARKYGSFCLEGIGMVSQSLGNPLQRLGSGLLGLYETYICVSWALLQSLYI